MKKENIQKEISKNRKIKIAKTGKNRIQIEKIISVVMIIAAAVLLFSGCGNKKIDKVVMTYVSAPLNVPSVIEKERADFAHAFDKMGLGFGYSELTSGADQTAALASGDIHILNAVGGSSVILAAAGGADIGILSMYSTAPEAFAMFSNDDSINSPEDLKGLTVAGPKGTILHELLAAYLASADMTVEDIDFVSMDIPSAIAALEGKSADVALAGGAAAYALEQNGVHKICDGEGLVSAAIVTAASTEFIKNNPNIIEAFEDTQKEITDYIKNNEEEALKITSEVLDIPFEDVKAMYPLYDFDTEITEEDIIDLQKTADFLYSSGMIENEVNVDELIIRK